MGYTIENHSPKTETCDPPMYIYKYIYKKKQLLLYSFFVHKIGEIYKLSPFDFIFLSLFVTEYTHNNRQFIGTYTMHANDFFLSNNDSS